MGACRSLTEQRIQWAMDRLLECRSTTAVVTQMSAQWGISRRQSQRLVSRAHQQLADDLQGTGLDRRLLTAQLQHGLMEALSKALASQQPAAAVGAARALMELLKLAAGPSPLKRDPAPWELL